MRGHSLPMDFRFLWPTQGYGKSTGKPTHVNVVKDGQILFDYMLKHPAVANTKIIVYGASMGSQAAVHLTLKNQGKISALVIDGGLSSMTDIALASAPQAQHDVIKAMLKMPYEAKEDIKAIAGVMLLFIHSREDNRYPLARPK
ncbi:MAG: alpha/beta hydrolase [Bacteroidales bacterium]|nr:alpha/beta hydrolase [Bacteroidales bacterium]